MSVCISANILLSFQIRQTSQTSLDETQRNINKNIASGPKKIFVVIFLAVTGEFTPEIYLLLSHFKKDIEKICVQWITAKMLKKNSWTVMIVNKCVLWHNVDTACPQFHYLMLTMYIWRFLFFCITDLVFRDDCSQSQRSLHRNRKDMTSHAFPRWPQVGRSRFQR